MQPVGESRIVLHHVMRVEHVNQVHCYHHQWPLRNTEMFHISICSNASTCMHYYANFFILCFQGKAKGIASQASDFKNKTKLGIVLRICP
jgi:hypothetical protein